MMKNAAEIIRECLKEKGISQRQLARQMGEDVRPLNQQLNHNPNLKFDRFAEVMEALGYQIEFVDLGVYRVATDYANRVIESRQPEGKFWTIEGDKFIGIDNETGDAWTEEFQTKEECIAWLLEE